MVTRMDRDIGRLLALLKNLGLTEKTLVIFSSDNGPHMESGHNSKRFAPTGPLKGFKRSMNEGGIRVPTVAWWPGVVKAGTTSEHVATRIDVRARLLKYIDTDLVAGKHYGVGGAAGAC